MKFKERILEEIKKKNYILITLIVFIVAIIMCGGFVVGHYSADDYYIMNIGYNQYSIVNNLKEGRPIMCILDRLANVINLDYNAFIIITVVIAIFISSINIVILFDYIIRTKNIEDTYKKILILISVYVTIFNFMYIENLYFVEAIVMSIALLLYTIAAKELIESKFAKTIIYAIVATLCYNGFTCYFITIVLLLTILKDDKDLKTIIKKVIQSGVILLIAIGLNLIQINITCKIFDLNSTRTGNLNSIFNNLFCIIENLPLILTNTVNQFPKYLYLIFLGIMLLLYIISTKRNKDEYILLNYFLIIFVSIASNFCVSIVSLSSFETGRLLYAIGMTIGMLIIYILTYNKFEKQSKIIKNIIIASLILYFTLTFIDYIYIIGQHKIVNANEKQEVLQMAEYINKYEKENNIKVEKIAFIYNVKEYNGKKAHYEDVKNMSGMTKRATALRWSCIGVIEFYSDIRLEIIDCTSEMLNNYISSNNKFLNGYMIDQNVLICPVYDW